MNNNQTKEAISKMITQDLLNNDTLDLSNFPDEDTLTRTVADIIVFNLKDFLVISGGTVIQ